jgi:hypothetical protein
LSDIGSLIKENQYDLKAINPKNVSFDVDADHKTETYIIQLLKTCLIVVFLEIQETFNDLFEEKMHIEDFYTQLLFEPVPENSFIQETLPIIEIGNEEIPQKKTATSNVSLKSFTYTKLATESDNLKDLYDSLKKNKFIDASTTLVNFKKIFSGKKVLVPVVWTGNISELNYFIKLIHNTNQSVENLKQRHWEVACLCFVTSDGSLFDRAKLKEQKKPKTTKSILEKTAALL